jgi:HAD superfamily hydrolase (TIGR01509 family)
MTSTRGVLFDIDGTLVDTGYHHTIAWWQAFRDAGIQVPMREIHRAIGMGADQLLPHLIGRDDEDLRTGHDHYYAPYLEGVQSFEGAAELLRECKARGLVVVLATSSDESQLGRLRRGIGADDAIDHVTSASDVERSKPAPDLIQVALDAASLRPGDAVMVGDTRWDVESAATAGVPCVTVMTGGWSEAELRAAGAVEVWASPADLLDHLDESVIGRLAEL